MRHPKEPSVTSILLSPHPWTSMDKRQYECPLTFNRCLDEKFELVVLTMRCSLFLELHGQYPGFRAKVDQILSSDCNFTKYIIILEQFLVYKQNQETFKDIHVVAYFALVGRTSGNTMSSPKSGRFTYN